jgi:hypothetical protein
MDRELHHTGVVLDSGSDIWRCNRNGAGVQLFQPESLSICPECISSTGDPISVAHRAAVNYGTSVPAALSTIGNVH